MKKYTGFSLIELMITLVIMSILFSVAIPKMTEYFSRKTIRPIGNILEKTLQLARVEAIQRGESVYIIPIEVHDWASGWIIQYEDDNESPPVTRTIQRFNAPPVGTKITSDKFNSDTPIVIEPSGQAQLTGSFTLNIANCEGDNQLVYDLLISGMFDKQVLPCP